MWLLRLVGMCGLKALSRQTGLGLAMLFTLGFCGIGQFFDIFDPQAVEKANKQKADQALPSSSAKYTSSGDHIGIISITGLSIRTVDQASMDELDSLMKEAENALEQTQSKPNDHHGS